MIRNILSQSLLFLTLTPAACLWAEGQSLDRAKLPAAVNSRIDQETHGAEIKRISTERESGHL